MVAEFLIAGILVLFGLRSLAFWWRREFQPESAAEQVLYVLHVTARVGMWFALAGFFVGFAVVDYDPQGRLGWYFLVLIALAGAQLLTSFYLTKGSGSKAGRGGQGADARGIAGHAAGNRSVVATDQDRPGPLEPSKRGETADPGHPQPEAAEVESARLLANQARAALLDAGLTNEDIRRLADDYVAEDRGEDLEEFVRWAKNRARRGGGA
jgi:hypothetical protein